MKDLKLPIYLLNNDKYEGVINYPVIKINFLAPSISFDETDYLIFTSKNGVKAVDNITDKWKKKPSFAIGKATANEIKKRGGIVEFIASKAYGDEFAKEITQKYHNKKFLFLRAKEIISDIKGIFDKSDNFLEEIIIYETVCNKPSNYIKKPAIVIFTSPSTVKCFAKLNDFENILPIAIGNKTKKILLDYTENSVLTPENPSIKECIKLAKNVKLR
ncbi:uroporphyrinogen-III synthase [Lebetimonas natsushimae]|uniref:Uroporphyrinogen-III synthase n=1 Tax=Lebetimonas natsushimae TaxID=1936991 RepID=A0A292Y9K6_9BACT|nr:uroporphyrinogen-III synthase [Lebetimonas natsushimae]GAX87582.1 uroporphyrinogen-III synthase [Lebetimonas natsushimae]